MEEKVVELAIAAVVLAVLVCTRLMVRGKSGLGLFEIHTGW